MNVRHAVMVGLLGRQSDRFHTYTQPRTLAERLDMLCQVPGCQGIEPVYPSEFRDLEAGRRQILASGWSVSAVTISATRQTFVQKGLEAALSRKKPDREYVHCLDGEAEAHLIALACSQAPEGHERWSLRLLAQKMVSLEHVESVSHETVRQVLKKTISSLG